MAIVFKIKSSTPEENNRVQKRFHDALVGSPAYQNSEIAICDGTNLCNAHIEILVNGEWH